MKLEFWEIMIPFLSQILKWGWLILLIIVVFALIRKWTKTKMKPNI